MARTATGHGRVDVAVVGAGLSGLICARELRRRGLRVRLLEARERPGGRLHSRPTSLGLEVDLGGQWGGAHPPPPGGPGGRPAAAPLPVPWRR
ncbi:MAG: FAD-dependent oxidoreductase [Cyanobacteriota bacterium]